MAARAPPWTCTQEMLLRTFMRVFLSRSESYSGGMGFAPDSPLPDTFDDRTATPAVSDAELRELEALRDLPGAEALRGLPFIDSEAAREFLRANPGTVRCMLMLAMISRSNDHLEGIAELLQERLERMQTSPTTLAFPTLPPEHAARWPTADQETRLTQQTDLIDDSRVLAALANLQGPHHTVAVPLAILANRCPVDRFGPTPLDSQRFRAATRRLLVGGRIEAVPGVPGTVNVRLRRPPTTTTTTP